METINTRLDKINQLQQSFSDNSNICQSLIKTKDDNPLYKTKPQEYNQEILDLINTIMKEITLFKQEQYNILEHNFENTLTYKGKELKVIEIIKIKEHFKIKLDTLLGYSKILETVPNDTIHLEVQILIMEYRKEYHELNKLLNQFNSKGI